MRGRIEGGPWIPTGAPDPEGAAAEVVMRYIDHDAPEGLLKVGKDCGITAYIQTEDGVEEWRVAVEWRWMLKPRRA